MPSPSYSGQVGAPSSFGVQNSTWGPGGTFRARSILVSQRFQELDRKQSYYECTQHDAKKYDFDGRIIDTGGGWVSATQGLLSNETAPFYVPLRGRRPSAPYRLPRVIVHAFTNMLFGQQRFPSLRVEGDPDTQDFLNSIIRETCLPAKMIRARNIGGAVGTVGLSWCFDQKGKPRVYIHNGKHLFVHEWEDRDELMPKHVSEIYLYSKNEWSPNKKKYVRNWYWYRKDWMPNCDVCFQPVLYDVGQEPVWEPDTDRSYEHDDGMTHFQWIQNLPTENEDGDSDYEGLFESFDAMDTLSSVNTRGATLNLDPTLVLKMDPEILKSSFGSVKKGSDNSLAVGEEGEANYLELSGTALKSGLELFDAMRRSALETAQCIVPDPSEIAAQGVSSIALKTIFAPMLGKCDIYREQYAAPMKRMLEQMADIARSKGGTRITRFDDDGTPVVETVAVTLPMKVVRTPKLDTDGKPKMNDEGMPDEDIDQVPRQPGEGGEVEFSWPQYFPPTPDDQSKAVTTLSAATGGKAIMSQQTATELAAMAFGHEGDEEWKRVQKMSADDQQNEMDKASAFGANGDFAGGAVKDKDSMPFGAKPKPGKPGGGGAGSDEDEDDSDDSKDKTPLRG